MRSLGLLTELERERLLLLTQAKRVRRARKSLKEFTLFTKPDYSVNWHHDYIFEKLDAFIRGDILRLMLCMPPRHGKSELTSRRLPAYIFGLYPDAQIIATSYSADLASMMNRDVQRIIDDDRYIRLFPETGLMNGNNRSSSRSGGYLRNSDIFEIVGHRGSYRSAGIQGGVSGMGAHFLLIDDPFKNRAEASSPTIRKTVWETYTSALYTRLEPFEGTSGRVLVTNTRWHEDDLSGRIIEAARNGDLDGDVWEVINFPAIAEYAPPKMDPIEEPVEYDPDAVVELKPRPRVFILDSSAYDPRQEGEALWPSKYDEKALSTIRVTIGAYDWGALFQQHPSPTEGGILKRHQWSFWYPAEMQRPPQPVVVRMGDGSFYECPQIPLPQIEYQIQSWDCAFKKTDTSDFVVGQVWGVAGANKILLDQIKGRMDFPGTVKAVKALSRRFPEAATILIEDKANGSAVIASLRDSLSGIIPITPEGGKEARVNAIASTVESGNVFLPHPSCQFWVGDLIEECAAFPNATHDDQVDALSQALIRIFKNPRGSDFSFKWTHLEI